MNMDVVARWPRWGATFGAVVHWLLGDPRRAVERSEDAVASARRLGHPFSVVFALFFDAWVRLALEDREAVEEPADEALVLARGHGFRQFEAMAGVQRGWAKSDVEEMERGFQAFLATGSRMLQHFFLALLADVQLGHGRPADALATVERALAEAEAVGERFWLAELLRLRAEIAAGLGGPEGAGEPGASRHRALEVARAQGARGLEHRVAQAPTRTP